MKHPCFELAASLIGSVTCNALSMPLLWLGKLHPGHLDLFACGTSADDTTAAAGDVSSEAIPILVTVVNRAVASVICKVR